MLLKNIFIMSSLVFSAAAFAQHDYTGTYQTKNGSELLLQKDKTGYQFSLLALSGQNSGGLGGYVEFKQQQAFFTDEEYTDCSLNFSYAEPQSVKGERTITVEQTGSFMDCGFGNNVFADGKYTFVKKTVNFEDHRLGN